MAWTEGLNWRRLFTTPYAPSPSVRSFLARAQTQDQPGAQVTVAVLDAEEGRTLLGVPIARHGLQPVFLRISNRGTVPLRLQLMKIDPNYFTPLEAAGLNHFSLLKRLSAFGFLAFVVLPMVLLLLPSKLFTAWRANHRIDECFQALAFRLRPIAPGETVEGLVFTRLDLGTKNIHVSLQPMGQALQAVKSDSDATVAGVLPSIDFTFSIPVPGISVDYLRHDFESRTDQPSIECPDVATLTTHLASMPAATTDAPGIGTGDPVNLVIIGEFPTLISAFTARWDETETITLATCWKTTRSFLLGSQYRYSPVSPLFLFGRSQDVALQRSRRSINERLHLRLWLTDLRFRDQPVWIGQISRDIGVRLTWKTWNLTTHRIDPDVDESRDYVVEDLLEAERVEAAGYLNGVGPCSPSQPRHNLTGDPYFTDGKRAAILLSKSRTVPRFVAWQ